MMSQQELVRGAQSLEQLQRAVRAFCHERQWERFHSPKNLVMALSGEVGELIEHFQWVSEQDSGCLSADQHDQVAMEMADVLMYLVRLADVLEVDLLRAASQKMQCNARRYPVDKAKGTALKYDRL